jgi:hypothetical protein
MRIKIAYSPENVVVTCLNRFLVFDPVPSVRKNVLISEASEKICESLTLVAYIYSRRASSMIVLVDIPPIIYTRLFIKYPLIILKTWHKPSTLIAQTMCQFISVVNIADGR